MSSMRERYPECSVVVPTHGGTAVLGNALRSLQRQCIARDRYEVIVVDDGPLNDTARLCRRLARWMPLRLFRTERRGLVHAKNVGVAAARAPICLILGDTDIAHPDLLWQHVTAHFRDRRERLSIRGCSAWSPELAAGPLIRFASRPLDQPEDSDPERRWPGAILIPEGRRSFKTEFLRKHGPFDETLPALDEHELNYRLFKEGMQSRTVRAAVTYVGTAPALDSACRMAEARGRALVRIAAAHHDEEILARCALSAREDDWRPLGFGLRRVLRQVRQLESRIQGIEAGSPAELRGLASLFETYSALLRGLERRGVNRELRRGGAPTIAAGPTVVDRDMTTDLAVLAYE